MLERRGNSKEKIIFSSTIMNFIKQLKIFIQKLLELFYKILISFTYKINAELHV